jgi:hypothetical protein
MELIMNDEFIKKCENLSDEIRNKLFALESSLQDKKGNELIGILQSQIVTPLNELVNDIFYGTGISPKVGLMSYIELKAEWNKDWGNIIYAFFLGKNENWERHLSNINAKKGVHLVTDDVYSALSNRKIIFERVFAQDNLTGKILKQHRYKMSKLNRRENNGEIVGQPSLAGLSVKSEKIKAEFPWALVQPDDDFPMMYIGIFEYSKPLGFFQLSLDWPIEKIPGYDIGQFSNCFLKTNAEVQEILERACYFADTVLRDILVFLNQHIAYRKNMKSLHAIYDPRFIGLMCREEMIKDNPYYESLTEFEEYFNKGYCDPDELALKTICSMWNKNVLLETNTELSDLKNAEIGLFWSSKYREHLIHSLKVYLLGNYIISNLSKIPAIKNIFVNNSFGSNIDSKFSKYEDLWMLTATFHDFCVPIEYLSESQRNQFSKFIGTKVTLKDEYQKRLFLSEVLFREQMIYSLFHILHYHNPPSIEMKESLDKLKRDNYIFNLFEKDYYNKLNGLKNYGVVHHDILQHFFNEGDHGISSAIRVLKECFPQDESGNFKDSIIDKEIKLLETVPPDLEIAKNEIFKNYFQVIYAIFVHNFIEKFKADKDPIYAGSINFTTHPLAFLLILSDTIQDWGREESYDKAEKYTDGKKFSSRPLGILESIKFENNIVEINIEYKWTITENGLPGQDYIIPTSGCKNDDIIRQYCNKQFNESVEKCEKFNATCFYRNKFGEKWAYLNQKLNNNPSFGSNFIKITSNLTPPYSWR